MPIEFGRLTDLVKNGKSLSLNDGLFLVISRDETKEFILYLNRIEQLFKRGIGLDGDILGAYSLFTENLNRGRSFYVEGESKQKLVGEPYFMVDTFSMYKSFKVQVGSDHFTIEANTIKDGDDLEAELSPFVGLVPESLEKLIEFILPELRTWLLESLLKEGT